MPMPRRAPLTDEQSALAADPAHVKLALQIARARGRKHPALADEFESAALVALVDAAATFDPGHKVPFPKHASRRINGAMIDCRRDWMPEGFRRSGQRDGMPSVASLDDTMFVDQRDIPMSLARIIATDDDAIGTGAEYHDEVERLARKLPPSHGAVIRSLYGQAGKGTMKATAAMLGLCESRVSRIHSQAIAFLKEDPSVTMNDAAHALGSRLTLDDLPTVTLGPLDDADEVDATPVTHCPTCGTSYGKRKRCYRCKPAHLPLAGGASGANAGTTGPKAEIAAPAAEVVAPPAPATTPLTREIDAMRSVAMALEGLDAAACLRVLAYISAFHGGVEPCSC